MTPLKKAVFTICQNEPFFFPVWLTHYLNHFEPCDIHVLHHLLPEPRSEKEKEARHQWQETVNVWKDSFVEVPLVNDTSFDHDWLRNQVQDYQRQLLKTYGAVLFAEIDEIIVPRPSSPFGTNLAAYMDHHMVRDPVRVCTGYEVVHRFEEEPPLDQTRSLLGQRKWWAHSLSYSKPLMSRVPLNWVWGFHACHKPEFNFQQRDDSLLLVHLHKLDFDTCMARNLSNASRRWPERFQGTAGYQNRLTAESDLKLWWYRDIDFVGEDRPAPLTEIPGEMAQVI